MSQRLLDPRQPVLADDNVLPILRCVLVIRPALCDLQSAYQILLRRIETVPLLAMSPELLLPLHESLIAHRLSVSPAH